MSDWQQQPPGWQQQPREAEPPQGGFGSPPPPWDDAAPSRLDVGDLLRTATRIVAGNFGVFAAVAFAATLPGLAISQYFATRFQNRMFEFQQTVLTDPGTIPDFSQFLSPAHIGGLCLGTLVSFTLMYLAQAVLVYDVIENLAGRRPPIGQAIGVGMARAPAVLVSAFLLTLVLTAAVVPGALLGVLVIAGGMSVGPGAGGLATCCGGPLMLLGMLVPTFYAYLVFFVTVPAAVVEDVSPVGALARSFELTKGQRWRIFLAVMAFMLVIFVSSCIGGACSGALGGGGGIDPATGALKAPSTFGMVVGFLAQLVAQTLQTMGIAALAGVTYARIRGVRDGVDAQALAEVFS